MYLEAVGADSFALAAAARLGLDAPVPSCPDWAVRDLVRHIGMIHRWVTEMVRTRATTRLDRSEMAGPPEDDDELVPWFEEGVTALVDILSTTPPAEPAWNWSTSRPRVVGFWPRRMAHETVIHRYDAQLAHACTTPLDAALAVDGIEELFDTVVPTLVSDKPDATLGGSLHVHCTDVDGEWLVSLADGKVDVRREHGKGDAAVRGAVSDLDLFLWGRTPVGEVATFGDPAVLDRWADLSRL